MVGIDFYRVTSTFRLVPDWKKRIRENEKVSKFGSCPRGIVEKAKCWKIMRLPWKPARGIVVKTKC